ncbi:IS1 family transposase [Methyloglobulus sp.]|uniref:IS1 family transposase n=1 Tax=Methyloglobulus sp. TaxID=2518622 RepID=UPI003989CCCB
MDCPKCGKQASCKDGQVNGRQRYLCKDCHPRYTVAQRSGTGDKAVKRQALELYLEGLGFRSIGRVLGFSNVTILNWVRAFGEQLAAIKSDRPVQVVELDEMHSYVGSKKYCWIWIAVDRHGKRFLDCVLGPRGTATGEKLWQSIADVAVGRVMTDHWQPYEAFVPKGRHTQSKAETFTVEGHNSLFRHFLARLRRKSKCYSKCQKMLEYSVRLLMAKWNNMLAILN